VARDGREGTSRRCHLLLGLLLGCIAGLLAPAGASAMTEYKVPTLSSNPAGITVGPDGALWFTEENGNKIGRITTDGVITEYALPTNFSSPSEITAGPDGALWFTEYGAQPLPKIGRLPVTGPPFKEWELPLGSGPDGITTGPDGAIWFTRNGDGKIGRITTDGTSITDYPLQGYQPGDITPGPDGRLWFTESGANKIGAITVDSTPEIKEYDLAPLADPSGIAASGGAMWFTEYGLDRIGRIPTFGLPVTEFGPTGSKPSGIALGQDGALWFTETVANKIGRMTTTGRITEFPIPTAGSGPGDIVAGPDGAMWFTEFDGNNIGRIEAGSSLVVPPAPPAPPLQPATKTSTPVKSACRVPRVRGLTVRKARKKLRRAGCRYRIRGRGRIVSSRPRAGARTRSTVQLRARRPKR
jgi:virginiamycin B lyase